MTAVLDRIQRTSMMVGGIGLLALVIGAIISPAQFFRSYLIGYLLWAGVALGALALSLLHNLTGGNWGRIIKLPLESALRTLPFVALLLLPILFGLPSLYEWTHSEAVSHSHVLQQKTWYLNTPFFLIRLAVYFIVWLGLAFLLKGARGNERKSENISGIGLLLYAITASFAGIDLAMSLEPEWVSTIFGALVMVGQVLSALTFMTTVLLLVSPYEPFRSIVQPQYFHDLGNLILAFVMLWAYVSFSQFLIIWAGNLPEEIPWYLHRFSGGWEFVGGFLLVFHFFVPFLLLLSRRNKRNGRPVMRIALALLFMRFVDLVWIVVPAFHPGQLYIHWMDFAAPLALGGIWIWLFAAQLKKVPNDGPQRA